MRERLSPNLSVAILSVKASSCQHVRMLRSRGDQQINVWIQPIIFFSLGVLLNEEIDLHYQTDRTLVRWCNQSRTVEEQ